MTARPQRQAIPARSFAPVRARKTEKLRRQLFVERLFFLAVIALMAVFLVRQARALRIYQVTVDGRPVAIVGDRGTANRLLHELAGGSADARFRQVVAVQRVDPRAAVMPEKRAHAALAATINVIVPGYVILVNGKLAAGLSSREEAEQVLARLRETYAGTNQKAHFKESVRIEATDIPRARLVSTEQAFRALAGGAAAGAAETYRVQPGDTASGIAANHGISTAQLAELNPKANLNRLATGQVLTVGRGKPTVTVVSVEERTEIEPIPHSSSVQVAPDLPRGERRVIAPGRDGEKTVRSRVARENGRVVKREVVSETVTRPPQSERVAVGAGA